MQKNTLSSAWFDQASKALTEAQASVRIGRYARACILAQQAAEKALVALYAGRRQEPWGCSVSQLLRGLSPDLTISEDLVEKGRALDNYLTCGAGQATCRPAVWWGPEQSELVVQSTRDVVEFARTGLDCQLVSDEPSPAPTGGALQRGINGSAGCAHSLPSEAVRAQMETTMVRAGQKGSPNGGSGIASSL